MTASPSPDPQHLQALARANEVRLARAELKRSVADGSTSAVDVLLDVPWEAETMPIADLLLSQRRWGHTRSRKFLRATGIGEHKPIGTMTERQRRAIAAQLERPTSERTARRHRALEAAAV